jgi:hypothetical protein
MRNAQWQRFRGLALHKFEGLACEVPPRTHSGTAETGGAPAGEPVAEELLWPDKGGFTEEGAASLIITTSLALPLFKTT